MANADPSVVEMCNNDEQCIYDAVQTGSIEVGMATLQVDANNQQQFTTSSKKSSNVRPYVLYTSNGC